MRCHNHNQDGISLIEVIISMFMVVVLFVLYMAALNMVATLKKVANEDIAYHIANKQMEALREIPFATLQGTTGTISDPQLSKLPSASGTYAASKYAPMSGMVEIVVTVNWTDAAGGKQVVLQTLAGNGGINP